MLNKKETRFEKCFFGIPAVTRVTCCSPADRRASFPHHLNSPGQRCGMGWWEVGLREASRIRRERETGRDEHDTYLAYDMI